MAIEVVFGVLVLMFALIGVGRGFLKELGTTTVMMVLLFFLSRFEGYIDMGMARAISAVSSSATMQDASAIQCAVLSLVVVATAFVSYHGNTLAFPGAPLPGIQQVVLGLLVGALNGYLIVGSVWYYLDHYGYPFQWLGLGPGGLSDVARTLVEYLPLEFLAQPVLLGESLLLYLSALLVLMRLIR